MWATMLSGDCVDFNAAADDDDDELYTYIYIICNKSERFASDPIQCVVLYGK